MGRVIVVQSGRPEVSGTRKTRWSWELRETQDFGQTKDTRPGGDGRRWTGTGSLLCLQPRCRRNVGVLPPFDLRSPEGAETHVNWGGRTCVPGHHLLPLGPYGSPTPISKDRLGSGNPLGSERSVPTGLTGSGRVSVLKGNKGRWDRVSSETEEEFPKFSEVSFDIDPKGILSQEEVVRGGGVWTASLSRRTGSGVRVLETGWVRDGSTDLHRRDTRRRPHSRP